VQHKQNKINSQKLVFIYYMCNVHMIPDMEVQLKQLLTSHKWWGREGAGLVIVFIYYMCNDMMQDMEVQLKQLLTSHKWWGREGAGLVIVSIVNSSAFKFVQVTYIGILWVRVNLLIGENNNNTFMEKKKS